MWCHRAPLWGPVPGPAPSAHQGLARNAESQAHPGPLTLTYTLARSPATCELPWVEELCNAAGLQEPGCATHSLWSTSPHPGRVRVSPATGCPHSMSCEPGTPKSTGARGHRTARRGRTQLQSVVGCSLRTHAPSFPTRAPGCLSESPPRKRTAGGLGGSGACSASLPGCSLHPSPRPLPRGCFLQRLVIAARICTLPIERLSLGRVEVGSGGNDPEACSHRHPARS